MISIIIPIFNEVDNIELLWTQLIPQLKLLNQKFEVIFVNDGSRDGSEKILLNLAKKYKDCKVVNLKRNYGQTAAMMAGFEFSRGDIVVPMDGDLQNDPSDIGPLIAKLNEGFDVVSGWRKNRQDEAIRRNFLSRVANLLISKISGVHLHDYGCTLKAYRKEIVDEIRLYGEMHRFIPIYASWLGAKVSELPVKHHKRLHGYSKYGVERVFKVVLDLLVVKFFSRYATKPIYIFGGFGLSIILISFLTSSWAIYLKLFNGISLIQTPLPLISLSLFITGILAILMGLLAEIVIRTYYESQDKSIYLVKDTLNLKRSK
jgi:glycosyltransferase involved in cell wall biosynthesis